MNVSGDRKYWTPERIAELKPDYQKFAKAYAAGLDIEIYGRLLKYWFSFDVWSFDSESPSNYRIKEGQSYMEYYLTKNINDGDVHIFNEMPKCVDKRWVSYNGAVFSEIQRNVLSKLVDINPGECIPFTLIKKDGETTIKFDHNNKKTHKDFEPKYRPWTWEDKCSIPNEIKLKQAYGSKNRIVSAIHRDGLHLNECFLGWNTLFNSYEQLDGTPCGIKL